jgi:hypothetical protein
VGEPLPDDRVGRTIRPGCFIAYGHALGRSAGLRIGKVLAVSRVSPTYSKGYAMSFEWRIKVRGISDDWSFYEPTLLSKDSTLFFPERMIVLDSVPEKYARLFTDARPATRDGSCECPPGASGLPVPE